MFSNTKGIYLNKESSNWRLSQTNQTHLQCVSYYVQMRNNTVKPEWGMVSLWNIWFIWLGYYSTRQFKMSCWVMDKAVKTLGHLIVKVVEIQMCLNCLITNYPVWLVFK